MSFSVLHKDFWTLWEKARVGWSERIALKHVYYQVWNRSPVQVGCMRQVLRAGALGRPRGMGWGGRWEGGSGWETHVNPWLTHVNVWQKPLQYCKVISLQLIKINEKNKKLKNKKKGQSWGAMRVILQHPILLRDGVTSSHKAITWRGKQPKIKSSTNYRNDKTIITMEHSVLCVCGLKNQTRQSVGFDGGWQGRGMGEQNQNSNSIRMCF